MLSSRDPARTVSRGIAASSVSDVDGPGITQAVCTSAQSASASAFDRCREIDDLARMVRFAGTFGVSLVIVVGLACATPLPERPAAPIERGDLHYLTSRLDWEANAVLEEGAASLTIALFDDNGIYWERGYGFASVEEAVPATPQTFYRVGSISKLITSIAVMQLVAQGLVELDAPLTRYLPEFELGPPPPFLPNAAEWTLDDITIRSMLTHHSGIPSDIFSRFFAAEPAHYTEYVTLLRGFKAQAPVGLVHAYSNVAMTLLGHVVERVSGDPFPRYAEERVMRPSGMARSTFRTELLEDEIAKSYVDGDAIDPMKLGAVPAGALVSSARELAAFGQMALRDGTGASGEILSSKDLRAMWRRQNGDVALDSTFEMGLGWFRDSSQAAVPGGGLAVGHSGGMLAHRSHFLLLPEHDLGVAVLTNAAEAGPAAQDIVYLALRLALEARRGVPFREWEPAPPRLAESTDPGALADLAGRYATLATAVRLERRGDALRTQAFTRFTSAELRPAVDGSFRPRLRFMGLLPLEPDELKRFQLRFRRVGAIDAVYIDPERGPEFFVGWRVDPSPATAAWKARLGRYRVANATDEHLFFEEVTLELEEGRLVLSIALDDEPRPLKRYLEPLSDSEACDWTLGRGGGARVFARNTGGGTELELLGFRLRPVE